LGVISSTSTSVEIGITSASGMPGVRWSSSSTRIPAWSVPIASSSSARIIPFDSIPRSLALRSVVPSGITAPGVATATVWPAATLGAPHTICDGDPVPMSTRHTLSRSASGCLPASSTLPTTKCSSPVTP